MLVMRQQNMHAEKPKLRFTYKMLDPVPSSVPFTALGCSGYFESRWKDTKWSCSLATLHQQASSWLTTGDRPDSLAIIRCLDISMLDMRTLIVAIDWNLLRAASSILLVDHLARIYPTISSDEIVDAILHETRLDGWSRVHIVVRHELMYTLVNGGLEFDQSVFLPPATLVFLYVENRTSMQSQLERAQSECGAWDC